MLELILGGGAGIVVVLTLFGILTLVNRDQTRRILQDLTKSADGQARRFDLTGDLLPPEETSLGPVRYERIPTAATAYSVENRQARHVHTVETGFLVPALTAIGTALALTVAAGALAWAFGWPARTVLIVFAVTLAGGWLWRLGVADQLVWSIEKWTRKDLDGDGYEDNPANGYALVNPGQARATAGRVAQAGQELTRAAELTAFYRACAIKGTSEGKLGISPAPTPRAAYCKLRDELIALGVGAWRDPARPRIGWDLVLGPDEALPLIEKHVVSL